MASFILNDETRKNSHGFYLCNAGGRFDRFRANPVMLHNHDERQHTGRWQNLRIEGVTLLAEPDFDPEDADAQKIKGKVDRGYLKGASPGIYILAAEWRTNAAGDNDIYVTDWELVEGSTVPIPSNAGALSLKIYNANHMPIADDNVKLHIDSIIKLSVKTTGNQTINTENKMSEMKLSAPAITALGITDTNDAAAISAAIVSLKASLDEKSSALQRLENEAAGAKQKQAETLVSLAISEGKIEATRRDSFIKLALADFDTAKSTLDAIPAKQSLAARIHSKVNGNLIPAGREEWTHLKWLKEDPAGLARIKAGDPQAFGEIKGIR